MSSTLSLTDALLSWTSSCFSLPLSLPADISDGVAIANILHKIDKAHFDAKWLANIKTDIPPENNRLKSSNVKKVLSAISDYYSDVLGMHTSSDFRRPDAAKVAEGFERDAGRMLQLLLGCAINCDGKQAYIESIMSMGEAEQQVIMTAIQELMSDVHAPGATPHGATEAQGMAEALAEANREREALKQKLHEMEGRIKLVEDEKNNLAAEYETFQKKFLGSDGQSGPAGTSASAARGSDSGILSHELKRQLESLQEELFKSESGREEAQVKAEMFERQLEDAKAKEAETQKLADQALKLKDEVDILRDAAEKAAKYEAAVDSYKKKLEDMADLRRQVKILEEKNTDYMQRNMELEEDVKKTGNWRPQVETYKKQLAELRNKVDSETKKSDRLEFDNKKLLEKVEALSVERDRLQTERDELKFNNSEMVDQMNFEKVARNTGNIEEGDPESGTLEMIPPSVKERLLRLQHENKQLRRQISGGSGAGGKGADADLMQTMVDDLREREKSLEAENRRANQRIMELESRVDELGAAAQGGTAPRIPGSREELELKLTEANKKISQLGETLQRKESEVHTMEERYKKHIEKAKSVIRALDPKTNQQGSPPSAMSSEVSALRNQISDKDRLIETMEQDNEKARAVREMEERLISSAFYNLSMQMHRNAVEARLNTHHQHQPHPHHQQQQHQQHHQQQAGGGGGGQSFLARQRQVAAGGRPRQQQQGFASSEFADY